MLLSVLYLMNAAARRLALSGVQVRVQYKLGVTVRQYQQHKALQYLIYWLIVLLQRRTSPVDSDYALPVITNLSCRVTDSAHLVVGPSLSLDRWLGIRCRLTSAIRRVVTSLSDVHWKHSCSLSTSVFNALEVIFTTMRYINQHYLSVYLSVYPSTWCQSHSKVKICLQTEFRRGILIHGWDTTTSGFEKQTSAILEFYFWFRFRPNIAAVGIPFCTSLRNFIQIGPPSAEK